MNEMNETLAVIRNRRSVRTYQDVPLERRAVDQIIQAAMRAPTAGNLMLYSILEIETQSIKDQLAESCDHQPFIAKAPLVLLFLADHQRWVDIYDASGVEDWCHSQEIKVRRPAEGDLMLACCDALIAAHTAVIAAESIGIGSCYIGDIIENYEFHRDLLNLPQYVFPITMVCFGYPTPAAARRELTTRFPQECIHFKDGYQRLDRKKLLEMLAPREIKHYHGRAENIGQHFYAKKFSADFTIEMTRSVRAAIAAWTSGGK